LVIGAQGFVVGSTFMRRRNFATRALPYLRKLRDLTRETANLAVVDDESIIVVTRIESRSARRRSCPATTKYSPLHEPDWLKITSPDEKASVCAEAVSRVLMAGGQESSSARGCVDTASSRFDLASDCMFLFLPRISSGDRSSGGPDCKPPAGRPP